MCRSSIALEEISSNISGNRAGVAVAEKHKRAIPFENEAEANAILRDVADEASFREFEARLRESQKSQGVRLVVRKRRISDAFAFVPVAGQVWPFFERVGACASCGEAIGDAPEALLCSDCSSDAREGKREASALFEEIIDLG
jgi:hypothetical protein